MRTLRFWSFVFLGVVLGVMLSKAAWAVDPTPTPVTDYSADATRLRNLNRVHPHLGDYMAALWHGRQTGGAPAPNATPTTLDAAAGTYMVEGVYVADASGLSAQSMSGINTTAGQYRKVTVCIDNAKNYALVAGTVSTVSQNAALKKPCPSQFAEVGYLELPPSFTGGSTDLTSDMCKQAAVPSAGLPPLHN